MKAHFSLRLMPKHIEFLLNQELERYLTVILFHGNSTVHHHGQVLSKIDSNFPNRLQVQ